MRPQESTALFSVISSLSKNKTTTFINKMSFQKEDLSEPSAICNKLNNYFCSVGVKLAQSLSSGSNNEFIKYLPSPNKNSMFCSPVTPDEITKILYKFPNNTAPGGDGINSKVLKVIGSSIATPLAHIFDLSYSQVVKSPSG